MNQIDILIVEDTPEHRDELKAAITGVLGKKIIRIKSEPQPIFPDDINGFSPSLMLFDRQLNHDFTGLDCAMAWRTSHPRVFVVLKSSGYDLDDQKIREENTKLDAFEKLGVGSVRGDSFAEQFEEVLETWWSFSIAGLSLSERYTIQMLPQTIEGMEGRYAGSARVIPDLWLAGVLDLDAQRKDIIELLGILGRSLAKDAGLKPGAGAGEKRTPYLVVPFDIKEQIPWELLLLTDGFSLKLDTPLVRLAAASKISARGRRLKRCVYVCDETVEMDSHLEATKEALGKHVEVSDMALKTFIEQGDDSCDILHITFHGPGHREKSEEEGYPNQVGSAGHAVSDLLEKIKTCSPRILVLNACNSLSLLAEKGIGYPVQVAPLQELLDEVESLEAIVVSQYLLAQDLLDDWCSNFYKSLVLFGDIGIALANARDGAAKKHARLWELASMVIVRENSSLYHPSIADHDPKPHMKEVLNFKESPVGL